MAKTYMRNQSRLRRKLRRFPETLRAEIRVEMERSAEELRAEIEARAPRDKVRLAPAAHKVLSRDGLSAKIGYSRGPGFKNKWKKGGLESLWQEFGTVHHKAQPFIRPAYRAKLKSILSRIDAAVNRTLNRASTGDF